MKFKPYGLFVVAIAILLLFSACTRTASTPVPKLVEEGEVEFPVLTEIGPTQAPIEIFGTQTAQALLEGATSEPPAVVETPTPEIAAEQTEEEVVEQPAAPAEVEATPVPQETSNESSFPVFEGYGPGFPTFGIRGVVADQSVTIQANDFPANQSYVILMGPMNTGAVNGIVIDTRQSGEGGSFLETYTIPDSLKSSDRIAIRIEFSGGRYAVNWFWNSTTY